MSEEYCSCPNNPTWFLNNICVVCNKPIGTKTVAAGTYSDDNIAYTYTFAPNLDQQILDKLTEIAEILRNIWERLD